MNNSKLIIILVGTVISVLAIFFGLKSPSLQEAPLQTTNVLPQNSDLTGDKVVSLTGDQAENHIRSEDWGELFDAIKSFSDLEKRRTERVKFAELLLSKATQDSLPELLEFLASELADVEFALITGSILGKINWSSKNLEPLLIKYAESPKFSAITNFYFGELLQEDSANALLFLNKIPGKFSDKDKLVGTASIYFMSQGRSEDAFKLLKGSRSIKMSGSVTGFIATEAIKSGKIEETLLIFKEMGNANTSSFARTLFHQLATTDLAKAKHLVENMTAKDAALGTSSIKGLISQWMNYEIKSPSEWLNAMDPGPIKDAGIEELCQIIVKEDPLSAAHWSITIADEKIRTKAVKNVYNYWHGRSPEEANLWFGQNNPQVTKVK